MVSKYFFAKRRMSLGLFLTSSSIRGVTKGLTVFLRQFEIYAFFSSMNRLYHLEIQSYLLFTVNKIIMRVSPHNNPESRSFQTLELPTLPSSNYTIYEKSKNERKELERKRRELEEAVAMMRRKAHEASKKFNQTQGDLMATYHKKLETVDHENQKKQYDRKQQLSLQTRKNMSSLSRYLHQLKKEENERKLSNKKQGIHNRIRSEIKNAETQLKNNKEEELARLLAKNREMHETMRQGVKWARDRSLQQKRNLSKNVRNDLISIESSRVQEEQDLIQRLKKEQEKIDEQLARTKDKEATASNIKEEIQNMDLYDFQARIITQKNPVPQQKHGKAKSERNQPEKRSTKHYSSLLS